MTTAERFRAARLSRGLTQQHVADILEVTQGAINSIESGRTVPSLTRLRDYADLLGWERKELSDDLCSRTA